MFRLKGELAEEKAQEVLGNEELEKRINEVILEFFEHANIGECIVRFYASASATRIHMYSSRFPHSLLPSRSVVESTRSHPSSSILFSSPLSLWLRQLPRDAPPRPTAQLFTTI